MQGTNMDNIVLLGFVLACIGLLSYVAMMYNGLVALKNDIDKAWANIDVILKQRHDEVSKLLDVLKGDLNYERETLQKVVKARSMYQQADNEDHNTYTDP